MASSTSSSSLDVRDDDETSKRPLTRVPVWIPISAFIGTSLALAIPLLMLRRQRAVLKTALKDNNPPPPRRVSTSSSSSLRRLASLPTSSTSSIPLQSILSADSDSPSLNTISALSHVNSSSALLAAKAFAIATGIVVIGGTIFVWGVKETLGVQDAHEFGNVMRRLVMGIFPSLPIAIHRPPQTPEEHQEAHSIAPFDLQEEDWRWEDAEERLKRAYEEGGVSMWGQMALRELEAEARLEREKRNDELKSRTPPS